MRLRWISPLLLSTVILFALWPIKAGAVAGSWTQTKAEDFESGALEGLDTSTSPGNVMLALDAPSARAGYPAIDRASSCCVSGDWTVIFNQVGQEIPVSGSIVRFRIFAASGGMVFKLKVFADNGTHFVLQGEASTPSVSAGYNFYNISPIPVKRGDLLGYYKAPGVDLDYDPPTELCIYRTGDSSTQSKSAVGWFSDCAGRYSMEAEILPDVTGTLLSMVKDTGGSSVWGKIDWTSTTPEGTSISLRMRSSNDSVVWSFWSSEYPSSGSSITSPAGRYIQYKALLTGSANSTGILNTPVLEDVTVNYDTMFQQAPFLETNLPWLILAAVVVGFALAALLTKPKRPKG